MANILTRDKLHDIATPSEMVYFSQRFLRDRLNIAPTPWGEKIFCLFLQVIAPTKCKLLHNVGKFWYIEQNYETTIQTID